MKKFIIALIALNAGLGGYLLFALATRPSVQEEAAEEDNSPSVAGETGKRRSFALFRPATTTSRKVFGWDDLASADLNQFVANLRAVQCPEETIRDIILAEVGRRYGSLESALKVRPEDVPPWEAAATYNQKAGESKLRQLLEEKRALLKSLVGVDVPVEMPNRLAGRDVSKFEGAYKELPPDKQELVRQIQEKYWSQSDDIKARTVGFLEPEDREEFARIKNERRDALAQALTPTELAAYEMRTSATAETLRKRFEGFETTAEEFSKIFGFMQPLDDEYSLGRRSPDPENKEFMDRRTKAEQAVTGEIQTVLGEERYAEYQRTRDPAYRSLNAAATEMGLPKESVIQAYEAQKLVAAESSRIARDQSLSPEQRLQSFQAIQSQAQQAFQSIFGDRTPEIMSRFGAGNPGGMDPALARRYGLLPGQAPQSGATRVVPRVDNVVP